MNKEIEDIFEELIKKGWGESADVIQEYITKLQQENKQLKEDKKKARKYIDEEVLFEDMFGEGEDTFLEDVNTKYYKGLKEILGDKE